MYAKKLPRYVFQRKSGTYQYKRNVPKRLRARLGKETLYRALGQSYAEMIKALPVVHREIEALFQQFDAETAKDRTLAVVEANFGTRAAQMLAAGRVDENLEHGLWDLAHKLEDEQIEPEVFSHLLNGVVPQEVTSLSKAFQLYAEYKDADTDKKLQNQLTRTMEDLRDALGRYKVDELPLGALTRADAVAYRDNLLQRVSPNSVTRYVNTVRAVVNHTINELGLSCQNPFHNLKVKGAGNNAGDRKSLSEVEVMAVLDAIPSEDLQALFIALCDTGARLAEVSGALCGDMNLQDRTLTIQENVIRGLKTESSKRTLPLSGRAYDALFRLRHQRREDEPLFTRYGRKNGNTSASAALMKHFRPVISDPKKSIHSLRHRKKDQLRQAECPEEISKVLLGHSNKEVAARYGDGYQLDTLRKWLSRTW